MTFEPDRVSKASIVLAKLTARLDTAERQIRLWRGLTIAILVVVPLALAAQFQLQRFAATHPPIIAAPAQPVVAAEAPIPPADKPPAPADPLDVPEIVYGKTGMFDRVIAGAVEVLDSFGQRRFEVAVDKNNVAIFRLLTKEGQPTIAISDGLGDGSLLIWSADRKALFSFGVEDGTPTIYMQDATKASVSISTAGADPVIQLKDATGETFSVKTDQ